MMTKSKIKILLLFFLFSISSLYLRGEVRYANEEDKARIEKIIEIASSGENYGQRVALAAQNLTGIPEGKPADNDSIGTIMVRLDSIDRMSFVNMALAIAQTAMLKSPGIKDFEKNLEGVSRLKGKDEGFVSQFLYGSQWIVDNVYRGNLKEMTEYVEAGNYKTKTLDRVSRHREDYPAMKDSSVNERIKIIEMGYRSHRIPHLKKQSAGNKNIQENMQTGDIIMMLPADPDYDVYDIGVVEMKQGVPHLIHISPQTGKFAEDEYPLARLFKLEGQHFYGFRWLRPTE